MYDDEFYNVNGFNAEGYDRQGLDVNGHKKVTPISLAVFHDSPTMTTQARVYDRLNTGKDTILTQFSQVMGQFNQHDIPMPEWLRDGVSSAAAYADTQLPSRTNGEHIVHFGLSAIGNYIRPIVDKIPEGPQREKFIILLDTFRTQAYVDHRAHSSTNPSFVGMDNSQTELHGLYTQLRAMGVDINNNEINAFFDNVVIPDLASPDSLHINPGLMKTLLNQTTSFEQYFAIVDDAKAQGFSPVTDRTASYIQLIYVRSLDYARGVMGVSPEQQQ